MNGLSGSKQKLTTYKTLGIRHETIHPHVPEEDGHIESYFGRFKEDYVYTRVLTVTMNSLNTSTLQ